MPNKKLNIGIVGAGVMGRALIKGMIESGNFSKNQISAVSRSADSVKKAKAQLGIKAFTDYKAFLKKINLLIICVKPSQAPTVMAELKKAGLKENCLVVSILAGVQTKSLEEMLETDNPVIRAMPNTPCIVQKGMTVICGGKHASPADLSAAERIFKSVGAVLQLSETHFDAVTALGGSGPAYLFLVMEALADGGVRVGLPRSAALKIIVQTVLGAASMVQETGLHPAALRDDVTTPAGCTIGALLIMEDGKIRSVLARAVEEATRIAKTLGEKKI